MQQFLEAAAIALQAIWANKLRSLLTVLGNIVAVTSIIAVVSLVQGLNAAAKDAIQSQIGADTFQVSRNNQIIAFYNKRNKLQDRRGFGPTTPLSAAQYQASTNYLGKIEWTSVLNNKMFLDVLYGYWGNFFPLRPTIEQGVYDGPWGPGRQDLTTSQFFDGGANSAYQNQRRFKPQFYTSLSYFKDGWKGSHDFKFGFDKKLDRRNFIQDQPFDIFYRDQSAGGVLPAALNQVDIYNTPVSPYNDVKYIAGWLSDTWKVNNRLTVNYGGRLEHYNDGWPDQEIAPNNIPALKGWTDPTYQAFMEAKHVSAQTVSTSTTFAPRVGFAYDLTGDNKTVLKAYFGQFRFNSADTLADQQNPVGKAQLRYRFVSCSATVTTNCDLNGNRLVDSRLLITEIEDVSVRLRGVEHARLAKPWREDQPAGRHRPHAFRQPGLRPRSGRHHPGEDRLGEGAQDPPPRPDRRLCRRI